MARSIRRTCASTDKPSRWSACRWRFRKRASFRDRLTRNGLSVRVVKDYDITNDVEIIRLDILYGVKAIYPDLACRLTG